MCKKMTYLICFILVPGLAGSASADLVARWSLDDGAGTVAKDSSGNGHDGTISGDSQWVPGHLGGALRSMVSTMCLRGVCANDVPPRWGSGQQEYQAYWAKPDSPQEVTLNK